MTHKHKPKIIKKNKTKNKTEKPASRQDFDFGCMI